MITFDLNDGDITEIGTFPLYSAAVELKAASDAYQKMNDIGVGSFLRYEIAWQNFLQSLERFWNKLNVICYGKAGWQPLKSKYERLRKEDPLLKYLTQARNVSEHTISPVLKDWDAQLMSSPVKDGIQITWQPWDRPLLAVVNRGTTYNPPKKHLEKSLSFYRKQREGVEEPKVVAELAMKFYVAVFNEIATTLFK